MIIPVPLKVISADRGVVDTDKDGNALPIEKHFHWANITGISPVPADSFDKIGNLITKLSCEPHLLDKMRDLLKPGDVKDFVFSCEQRTGAKNKMQLFAVDLSKEPIK